MMSPRSNTADSLPTLRDSLIQTESNKSHPVLPLPHRFDRQCSNPIITALSPPPLSRPSPPRKKSHLRLRSDSGLALHTNQSGFRQYTDYSPTGSVPTRPSRARALSFDGTSSVEDFHLGHVPSTELQGFVSNGRVLPDFFEPGVIKLVFSNPETVQRLRRFAETRHGGSDIDFLLKVEEYSRALESLISSMSYISSHFTGTTATSPLGLPLDVARSLKSNIKSCARTALPALDRVYQEAKSTAEERLSQNLYPEYVKYQLAQCLTASLSATRPLTGEVKTPYPGLGDAFCLTDPLRPDNPVVSASDGLLSLSGYQRGELVGKNCRLLQGIATDAEAVCRVSQAVVAGREATELILNYRPDGTPYWNLLFICPLMENGIVRYFLGAQVDISENMGSDYKDILGVLNFGRPPEDFHPARASSPTSTDWSARPSTDNFDLDQTDDDKQPSRRRRFFRRFRRKSPSSRASSASRPGSTTSLPATDDTPPPPLSSPPRGYPPLTSPRLDHHPAPYPRYQQHLDEHSTPYSRFLVLRYNPTSPSPTTPPSSSSSRTPTPNPPRRRLQSTKRLPTHPNHPNPPQLPIAFISPSALSLLNLRAHEAHAVLDRDVFAVLASQLGSPSVSKVFRREVLGELGRGVRRVVRDLMVPFSESSSSSLGGGSGGGVGGGGGAGLGVGAGGGGGGASGGGGGGGGLGGMGGAGGGGGGVGGGEFGRNGGGVGVGGIGGFRPGVKGSSKSVATGTGAGVAGSGAGAVYGDGNGHGEGRPSLSGTRDRGGGLFSQVLFPSSVSGAASGKGGLRRVVSSWVPLKDADGKVGWVVLVLTPVEGSA